MPRSMKRPRSSPAAAMASRLAKADDRTIDELYGLEPVYEPDLPGATAAEATEFISVLCPYCWESFETRVDLTGGTFTYVEDCQVCCQPIELTCEVSDAGELRAIKPDRMD